MSFKIDTKLSSKVEEKGLIYIVYVNPQEITDIECFKSMIVKRFLKY